MLRLYVSLEQPVRELPSGPGWANGISLQLWTHLWRHSWAPSTWLILSSRSFTRVLQIATLVIETAGVLAIVPQLRTWIGRSPAAGRRSPGPGRWDTSPSTRAITWASACGSATCCRSLRPVNGGQSDGRWQREGGVVVAR